MQGLENSSALCEICQGRGLPVTQGDARIIPFEDDSFDAIIMIAVIHHINPEEHQTVLNEIARVLKPGAKALITNWAVEQPEPAWKAPPPRTFAPGLNMVLWKGKEAAPLPYWIMNKTIANEFIQNLPPPLKALDLTWSAGNWEFWLQKALTHSLTSESLDARPAV
jgi:SAM-dependent methyltransferase